MYEHDPERGGRERELSRREVERTRETEREMMLKWKQGEEGEGKQDAQTTPFFETVYSLYIAPLYSLYIASLYSLYIAPLYSLYIAPFI